LRVRENSLNAKRGGYTYSPLGRFSSKRKRKAPSGNAIPSVRGRGKKEGGGTLRRAEKKAVRGGGGGKKEPFFQFRGEGIISRMRAHRTTKESGRRQPKIFRGDLKNQ